MLLRIARSSAAQSLSLAGDASITLALRGEGSPAHHVRPEATAPTTSGLEPLSSSATPSAPSATRPHPHRPTTSYRAEETQRATCAGHVGHATLGAEVPLEDDRDL